MAVPQPPGHLAGRLPSQRVIAWDCIVCDKMRGSVRCLRFLVSTKGPAMPQSASDTLLFSGTSPVAPIVRLSRPDAILAPLDDVIEEARSYLESSRAASTRRAYAADWRDFTSWCQARQVPALPATAEMVALYLTELARTHKPGTLQRRISAISQAHQAASHASPTGMLAVRLVMAGIRRQLGTAQEGKAPALADDVKAMVAGLPATRHGLQERALLLVGFAGAFRRSELVALNVEDLQFTRAGLVITIRRSKTDQEGQGRQLGIPHGASIETCPVRTLKSWLKTAGIADGAIFRTIDRADVIQPGRLSDRAVARAVKRGAGRAGLDPSLYAGHSLRAGLATSAAAAGVEERIIARQTGHKSMTVLRRYIRDGELFRDNAAGSVGL